MQFLSKVPLEFLKKIRKLLLVTAILLAISLIGWRGNDYLAVKGIRTEAKRLTDQAKYSEAVDRLKESETKWTTETIRNQIKDDIEEYIKFSESNKFFEEAKIKYDTSNFQEAIELFNEIPFGHVNYNSAQAWIVLAEKKLAEGEKKEPKGSVAGVSTQPIHSSDISKDFNQVIPSPAVNANDGPKLEIIKGLFFKMGDLNTKLISYGLLLQDAANSYTCDINKWGMQYLPSGEYNPNYAGDPTTINKLYQQCVDGRNSILSGYNSEIESMKRQVRDYNRQILDIMATCQTNECANFYQEVVRTLEAEGYIVR